VQRFLHIVLFLSIGLILSACSRDIPEPELVEEPLETEQPLQTFTSGEMPITLQLENPSGDLQAQATVTCTLQHSIQVYSTTVKGKGDIKCPEIITYAKMRIILYRYDNTATVKRDVARPNFLFHFIYGSDELKKSSGKYCVDSTLNTLKTIGGNFSILNAWKAFCVTV
jgi:hypothetical protein